MTCLEVSTAAPAALLSGTYAVQSPETTGRNINMKKIGKIAEIGIMMCFFTVFCVSVFSQNTDQDGEFYYNQYCSRCHGNTDLISGDMAYYSKKTLMARYENRSQQLLNRLIYVEKYIKNPSMIQEVHKIKDKNILIRIVNYLSDPDIPLHGSEFRERGI